MALGAKAKRKWPRCDFLAAAAAAARFAPLVNASSLALNSQTRFGRGSQVGAGNGRAGAGSRKRWLAASYLAADGPTANGPRSSSPVWFGFGSGLVVGVEQGGD